MIDIHSHLVYGVDDGPSSMEESEKMMEAAKILGIIAIIATPHFHEGLFQNEKVQEYFERLIPRASEYGIELHPGHEVFINAPLPDIRKIKSSLTLGQSRYLLFELPFGLIPANIDKVLFRLRLENIVPILAHPERNRCFINDFDSFRKLIDIGCLVQVDAASITGVYGRDVKHFVKCLLQRDMVHFAASNAHCARDYTDRYHKAYRQIQQWAGLEQAEALFIHNPRIILDAFGTCRI